MSRPVAPGAATLRLLFEIDREDNPRLYDDLMRFKKGPKRVNRLRFLAHEGLRALHWPVVPLAAANPEAAGPPAAPSNDLRAARLTVQAFELPSDEDP